MEIVSKENAETALSALLVGARLDSFEVFSVSLNLKFLTATSPRKFVFLSTGEWIWLEKSGETVVEQLSEAELESLRWMKIGELVEQIGADVKTTTILLSGILAVSLGSVIIKILASSEPHEEIW